MLEIANVYKTFTKKNGVTNALQDVHLSIKKGEFVVLVGPSGCGKSTLLNIIAGLEKATSGQISKDGRPILEAGRHPATAAAVAAELGVSAFARHDDLAGRVDLVSVATVTENHYAVVRGCLAAGLHVLVEKPLTVTVAQADELIALAAQKERLLQVGHLERFNPVWIAARERIGAPLFIEAHRMAPFKTRGIDVSVVLDLMIHDLDLIVPLIGHPLQEVRASGVSVLTQGIDIANARLEFSNGAVANLTASRTSTAALRRMRLFQRDEYLSVDFGERRLAITRRREALMEGEPPLETETRQVPPGDALMAEIRTFVASVRARAHAPGVCTGQAGRDALAVALDIERLIQEKP